MVIVGSCAPRTWSVLLSGGNMDGDSGPGVGSARSVVQAGGVGIIIFGVADAALVGKAGAGAQAVMRMEIKARHLHPICQANRAFDAVQVRRKKEKNFGMFDSVCSLKHPHLIASWSCSKDVIQAMVLMKSSSESLCSRRARTAGPTGSSPAAPPGTSAYAP